jgi:acetyl esterase/lipase
MSNWKGKKILICSGQEDKLVNYVDGGTEAFVKKLMDAGVEVEVFVQEGW